MWLHNVSDVLIWLAYTAIPAVLIYFIRRRPGTPFHWMFWMFGAFILACGTTHLVDAVTFHEPMYRFSGLLKVLTALISWATVFALLPMTPRALELPGLKSLNESLEREVEERRRAEAHARAAEERAARQLAELQLVYRTTPVGLGFLDRDLRFVRASEALARIQGMPLERSIGRTVREVVPELADRVEPLARSVLATGAPVLEREIDATTAARPGEMRTWLTSYHPVEVEGRVVGVNVVVRDVTELRQAQEVLRQRAAELARSNEELEQFAYVASHDLQEPLRMVATHTQLLARRYRGRLDADADAIIATAAAGVERMQSLIRDLLELSRAGRRMEHLKPVALEEVLDEVLENLAMALAESAGEVARDPLPVVLGDRSRMVQLLQNLVGNALKFCGERPPRVRVWARPAGELVELAVADNGIGIEPRYAERVFVVFQRLHGRSRYPGTGIGLSIARRIVENHGGRIWLESVPGEGTTFRFTLRPAGSPTA